MQKNDLQAFYEQVYESYNADEQSVFDEYERNCALKRIYHPVVNQRVLDLGAGRGTVSRFLMEKGYEVYAIEWTVSGVQKLNDIGIKATQQDIEDLPYHYEDGFFDEIFWGDNIEHLFFPARVAKELYRILKPGGRLVLSTPNHGWIINRLYYLIKGVPRRTEGQRLPIWEWQHIRYFNKQEIRKFLQHCGFTKQLIFHGAERRQPFSWLSRFLPSLFGSVMVVEVRK